MLSEHPLDAFNASEVAGLIGASYALTAGYLKELYEDGTIERSAVKVAGVRRPVYYYYLPSGENEGEEEE